MVEKETYVASKESTLFDFTGSFGPWQRRVFIIFFLLNIAGIWQNFAVTFLAPNMDYRCISPMPPGVNETWRTSALYNSSDRCEVRIRDESNGTHSVPCTEWEYDTSEYAETIVNEWDLVCDREWLVSFTKSIYMIGFMVSMLVSGQISDSIGRFPTIMILYIILIISSTVSALSTSYTMFAVLRFFAAFGRTGMTTTGFVLLMETVGPEWRTVMGIAFQYGWSVGFMTLPAVAYFVRPWYWFQFAIAAPTIPMICAYWLLPESPRWLMTHGKKEKFVQVMTHAAQLNGRDLDKEELLSFAAQNIGKKDAYNSKSKTFLDLVNTPVMAKRTVCMGILWLVNAFVYYALSYNTNDLGGDPYINFFISGFMEFLAYTAIYFSITRLGRKISLIVGMMTAGGACALIMAVPQQITWLVITLSMIGKFCISATFGLMYVYTTEMFPTVIRNLSIGTCSTCGRIGSITSPFVRELEKATHYTVPFAVNAGMAILSSLLTFFLPETKGRNIPDTMEEGQTFDEETSLMEKPACSKKELKS